MNKQNRLTILIVGMLISSNLLLGNDKKDSLEQERNFEALIFIVNLLKPGIVQYLKPDQKTLENVGNTVITTSGELVSLFLQKTECELPGYSYEKENNSFEDDLNDND